MLDKVDSGGSWAPFGRGLGRSGPPLGHFWALFGRYLGVLNQLFFKHRSKMESKRPFGSILEGFWEDSGRLWEGFGEGLGRIWEDFFSFSANLVSREILINFVGSCDPRAAPPTRLASQCAGVSDPSAC